MALISRPAAPRGDIQAIGREAGMMDATTIEQHSLGRSIILHLLPGAVLTLVFALAAPPMIAAGYPSMLALLLAILVALIPLEIGYLVHQGRRMRGRNTLEGVVVYREAMPAPRIVAFAVLLILWAGVVFAIAAPLETMIRQSLFGWLPEWFTFGSFTDHLTDYSRPVLLVTAAALVVLNGFAGPIVEEMYFRGYLLPRISRFGRWAPVINITLFSIYHFWSPWQVITRIVGLLPLAFTVYRKRNIYIGMLAHVLLNLIGVLLTAGLVLSLD